MDKTESKQQQVEQSQDNAPVQDSEPTAAASDPQAQNEQKSQGVDLAHGNTSELIARGESMIDGNDPYTAMNYYVEGGAMQQAYYGLVNGSLITEHTFGELNRLSPPGKYEYVYMTISFTDGDSDLVGNFSLFALGKYQMVPEVRWNAMAAVGLSETDLFSPQNQDLCFTNYLIVEKRPAVMAYLKGEGDIEAAAYEIAMEWAAVGVAPGRKIDNGSYGADNGLTSYYDGVGGNAASVSYEEIKAALEADRAAIQSGGIATHTAVTSMDTPASIYPSSNIEPQANNVSEANAAEPVSTNIDVEEAVAYNRMYGYSAETWIEIQRGIGMPEAEVDGDVGPITSQAIADWQASRGFTASDVDGICGPMTLDAIRSGMPAVSAAIAADPAVQQANDNPAVEQPVTEPAPAPAPAEPAPVQAEPAPSANNEPAPAPAEPAPAPAQAEPEEAALLTPEQVQAALDWNNARDYTPETITIIQRSIGAPETGQFCAADMQKIAAWQQLYGLPEIDGMFGNQALRKSTIKATFNHGLYHYLGYGTADWCTDHGFYYSDSLDDLDGDFKESAKKVVNGIRAAGGSVDISVTFRHQVRAAIMNFSVELDKDAIQYVLDAYNVDVDGDWDAAYAARQSFGIGNNPAAVNSNHIYGLAIDMCITDLPRNFQCGDETITTHGNQGGWAANAEELDNQLRNYAIGDNFYWFGYGDSVHWSYNGH